MRKTAFNIFSIPITFENVLVTIYVYGISMSSHQITFNKTLFDTKHIQINIYIYIILINCTQT